jgi:predicted NUDIX family phosphoesterase
MGDPNKKIIVVKRDKLFGNDYFQGFSSSDVINYESRVLKNMEVMRRGSTEEPVNHVSGNAEMNPAYKQPIGYTIIANSPQGKIFAYQRSSNNKNYGEKRLQGKWSWGFGGHIEPFDSKAGNTIRKSILREISEEAGLTDQEIPFLDILGYINEDVQLEEDTVLEKPSIGRVHFGILYLAITGSPILRVGDPEIARVELKTVSELEKFCTSEDVEDWSRIALEPLRKIL